MVEIYPYLFKRFFYPFYETALRGRGTMQYAKSYQANQWLTADELAQLQWRRLKALLDHCWEHVPYYRNLWRALGAEPGDITDMSEFEKLPVLTKQDIIDNFADIQSRAHAGEMMFKSTGGSTGQPLRFGYTRESYEQRIAVMWRGYGWAGADLGRKTVYLWSDTLTKRARRDAIKDKAFNRGVNRMVLNSFKMRDDNLRSYRDDIVYWKPKVVVGFVGPLVRLSKWMLDAGLEVPGVESIICASEALHQHDRIVIESAFPGAKAFNTYGCREFMLIASECECRDGLHANSDHLAIELLDPAKAPAVSGDVTITDLGNYGMPFIRYQNGDLATWRNDRCSCGRGLPVFDSVDGRKLDVIRTPDGRALPGIFFPHFFKDIAAINRFQVVQKRLDHLKIRVVLNPGHESAECALIASAVVEALGDQIQIDVECVDDIALSPSGKLRVTVSELDG